MMQICYCTIIEEKGPKDLREFQKYLVTKYNEQSFHTKFKISDARTQNLRRTGWILIIFTVWFL